MKKIPFLLLAALAVALVGCVVTSVCPFYTEKDLVFEPALVGNWLKQVKDAPDEVWRFERTGDRVYRFTLIEERKATVMEAHAFKLQGQLFLDVSSLEQDIHVIPPHYLLRVTDLTSTSLQLAQLDNEWLKQLLAGNPAAIAHHVINAGDNSEDIRVVLTADTPALQRFILDHLKTSDAWKDSFDLRREPLSGGKRNNVETEPAGTTTGK
jgi:hypothetical protein